jgi:putative membrane protein
MNAEEKLGKMIRYLIRAPDWSLSFLAIIIISIFGGFAMFSEGATKDALSGFLIFGLPTILSALVIFISIRALSGVITLDRSFLFSLVACSISVSLSSLGHLVSSILSGLFEWNFYVLSLGIVGGLSFLAFFTTAFPGKFLKSVLISSIYPLFGSISVFVTLGNPPLHLSFSVWMISIGITALLIRYLDAPLKSMGVSGFEFVYHFLEHERSGSSGMEEIFRKIGEEVVTPVNILSFKSSEELVGALIVPNIHPGPLGEIGGGNFPSSISSSFSFPVLVAHGTCNHDFNPVSRDEVKKIVLTVEKSIYKIKYSPFASLPVRVKEGSVNLLAQRFGDSVLMVCTTSPEPTEDIDLGIGLSACYSVKSQGYENVALIDAHNCGEPYCREIFPGDKRALEVIRAAEKVGRSLKKAEMMKTRIGIASHPPVGSRKEGFGDDGIKALVVETGEFRTAYVLIDGNNMVKGLREEILRELPVDEAEIMTTDNHVVNIKGGDLFVGASGKRKRIVEACVKTVEEAISNLRDAEVGMVTEFVEGIRVFGVGKSSQLSVTAAVTLSIGKGLVIYALLSVVSLCLLAFLLF